MVGVKGLCRAQLQRFEQIGDSIFMLRVHAFDHSSTRSCATGDQDLLVECRRGGNDVRLLFHARQQLAPVPDAIIGHAHQVDVCRGRGQTSSQVLAEPVVDGQRNDQ